MAQCRPEHASSSHPSTDRPNWPGCIQITLDRVAALSGVTVQTVLRVFGSKEALILAAIGTFRESDEPRFVGPSGCGQRSAGSMTV